VNEEEKRAIRGAFKRAQAEAAKKLEDLLSGREAEATLATIKLPQEEDPREPPTERLRRYSRFLAARRERFEAGDPAYGRCATCGGAIPVVELVDVPWAGRCRACAAGAAGAGG
jgi:RNA polymerase-binding transcription factor DksA